MRSKVLSNCFIFLIKIKHRDEFTQIIHINCWKVWLKELYITLKRKRKKSDKANLIDLDSEQIYLPVVALKEI